jgi:hypothetical protein
MSANLGKCPFTKTGCRECPIYRGRHCYIALTESQLPDSTVHRNNTEWIKAFTDFFDDEEGVRFQFRYNRLGRLDNDSYFVLCQCLGKFSPVPHQSSRQPPIFTSCSSTTSQNETRLISSLKTFECSRQSIVYCVI